MTLRVAFTADFVAFSAVRSDAWLRTPAWLGRCLEHEVLVGLVHCVDCGASAAAVELC